MRDSASCKTVNPTHYLLSCSGPVTYLKCMYECVYACVYVCMCICVCVCIYMYIYIKIGR